MIATPLGEAFVRRATAILNDVRRAQEEVEQLRGNAVGQLTVGLSIAAHLWLLPKVLEPFRRRFAHVHLTIIEGFYPTLEQHLQNGSIGFLCRSRSRTKATACAAKGHASTRPICSLSLGFLGAINFPQGRLFASSCAAVSEHTLQYSQSVKLVCFSSLIEPCRGNGTAFHGGIRRLRGSGWVRSGRAKPEPRGGLMRRNRSV